MKSYDRGLSESNMPWCSIITRHTLLTRHIYRQFLLVLVLYNMFAVSCVPLTPLCCAGSLAASQPRRASSSYSDSEPGSGPRSPSPAVSPSHGHQASASPDGEFRDESDKEDILMKETEQELLDEMIVKDVPESESSTDPVKKFEETLPPSKIESIHEEDSETECKDLLDTNLDMANPIPQQSQPLLSFSHPISALSTSPEAKPMIEPTKIIIKSPSSSESESEEKPEPAKIIVKSPSSTSETESEAPEPVVEQALTTTTTTTTDSETVEESPVILRRARPGVELDSSRPSSSDFSDTEFRKQSLHETINRFNEKAMRPTSSEYESDERGEVMSVKSRISQMESTDTDTQKPARPSSSEYSEKETDRSAAEESATEPELEPVALGNVKDRISRFNSGSVTSLDKETRFSEVQASGQIIAEEKKFVAASSISETESETRIVKETSDDEDSDEEDEKPMQSVKDRISLFGGSVTSLDRERSYAEVRKEGHQVTETKQEESVIKEEIIDNVSVARLEETVTSRETSSFIRMDEKEAVKVATRPLSSDYSDIAEEKKEIDEEPVSTSIKDRISRFDSGSVSSLDKVPRPASSAYSDNFEKKTTSETFRASVPAPRPPSSSASSAAATEDDDKRSLDLPVSSVKDKMTRFQHDMQGSQDLDTEERQRPVSSDYSDIFDPRAPEPKMEDEPMESIKERISRFNSGSVTSLNREEGHRVASRPSSGYSDFSEKKALFEAQEEETKASKISLVSATSSESESFAPPPRQSSSEYSDHEEIKIEPESQHEDISEVTEHQDTVRERISDKETSDSEEEELRPARPLSSDSEVDRNKLGATDSAPRRVSSSSSSEAEQAAHKANGSARPISSDYSDIFDKNEVGKQVSAQNILKEEAKTSSSEEEKEVATNIKRQDTSSPDVKVVRPVSSDYSDIVERTREETVTKKVSVYKYEDLEASSFEQRTVTEAEPVKRQDTSSSEEQQDDKIMEQSSSDSSLSKQKSDTELTRQDAFEIVDQDKKVALRRKQSSSEYSESDVESRRGVDSSSDYDSAANRGRQRRPDSMISDTSSDYDSVSNVGSRARGSRPASFLLDDDVITEESESRAEKDDGDDDPSSSSESEGPDAKDAGKKTKRIPPPGILKESSGEDEDQDGDEDQSTTKPFIPPTLIPEPTHSSVASSSILNQHAEQYSSVSHSVAVSSVTVSSSLEEYQSSNITKNAVATEITEKRSQVEDTLVTSKTSTTTTNIAQAKHDGSSLSDHSQGISKPE